MNHRDTMNTEKTKHSPADVDSLNDDCRDQMPPLFSSVFIVSLWFSRQFSLQTHGFDSNAPSPA